MGDRIEVKQADLQTREVTPIEQDEIDRRIANDEPIFDDSDERKEWLESKGKPAKKEEEGTKSEEKEEGSEEETPEAKSDEVILESKDEELNEQEQSRKQKLLADAKSEEDKLLKADDKELSAEDRLRKIDLAKKREDEKIAALNKEVESYASENSLTIDDARKEIESINKIVDKYKGDVKQLAKANLHSLRGYTELEEKLKTLSTPQPGVEVSEEETIKMIDDGKITYKGKKLNRDLAIGGYRNMHPDITEDLDDDKVFKMAVKDLKMGLTLRNKEIMQKQNSESLSKANEKREKLYNSLSESDKRFLPDVKLIIEQMPPALILKETFSVSDALLWAKGKAYDRDIKEREDAAYKRAIEQRKAIGEKQAPQGKTKPKPNSESHGLTEAQKERALDLFQEDIPVETKYKFYKEILDHDKELSEKKNKKQ